MSQVADWLTEFLKADDSQSKWRRLLGIGVMAGLVTIVLWTDPQDRAATASAFVLAGASLFTGILIGFLFGIPKTLQRKLDAQTGAAASEVDYQPNTNLEEISDWLTKMLVGVGLVQLRNLPGFLESIAQYWATSLGEPNSQPFAAGLVVYFGVIGFLLGYLWTRLALVGDFIEKDPRRVLSSVLRQVAKATERELGGSERSPGQPVVTEEQLDVAQRLQNLSVDAGISLDDMRRQLRMLAAQYDSMRATMASGSERTRKLEVIASQMRAFSLAAYSLLAEFAQGRSPGERLVAVTFLQAKPNEKYYYWLGERIRDEVAFLAYHAGVGLLNAARSASPRDKEILYRVISEAMEITADLGETTNRRSVLRAAMNALMRQEEEPAPFEL
jgi:hypothetical protein